MNKMIAWIAAGAALLAAPASATVMDFRLDVRLIGAYAPTGWAGEPIGFKSKTLTLSGAFDTDAVTTERLGKAGDFAVIKTATLTGLRSSLTGFDGVIGFFDMTLVETHYPKGLDAITFGVPLTRDGGGLREMLTFSFDAQGGDLTSLVGGTAGTAALDHGGIVSNFYAYDGVCPSDDPRTCQFETLYAVSADVLKLATYRLSVAPVADPAPVPGVPEPATWATMIAGLGLVGAAMRRRGVRVRFANWAR